MPPLPPSASPQEGDMSMPRILSQIVTRTKIIQARNADPTVLTLFTRKTSQSTGATKCPKCWDERLQGPSDPNDLTCFGTGFLGGYDKVTTPVRIAPADHLITIEDTGWVISYLPQAWIAGDTPRISNGDILVRGDNARFEVTNVTPIETQGVITRQDFRLKFLAPKDFPVLYSLQV